MSTSSSASTEAIKKALVCIGHNNGQRLMIDRSTIRRSRENSRRYSNNATCRSSADTAQCCVQSIKTHTRIYSRIDRPIPKHAWVDGQFDRLLIPNSGAFDLIKVKSRHWPQWGGYPCYNDRRIILKAARVGKHGLRGEWLYSD